LQKKGVKFEWTSKCEESFQQLKYILNSVPILNIVDPNEYFVVCIDACKEGLDGVLTKKYHVVCYESRKLKENERNHAIHDLELVSIIHALKMWGNDYLMGRKFELRTNHYCLKHFFRQPTLNVRQTRWLKFLVNMTLKLSTSKENKIKWLMHSIEEHMRCLVQPSTCTRLI
jgi:hypothetical protein